MPLDFNYLGSFYPKTRVGRDHSYTTEEARTSIIINQYVMLSQLQEKKLTDYTKADWFYCISTNGSVFKYNPQELNFYQLNLEKLVWIENQSYLGFIHDKDFIFQEFREFTDYFPHET